MASIGVAGATGALGKEILTVLDKTPWRPERVAAFASARSTAPHVDYGDTHVPVDDLFGANFDDLDVLILAVPTEAAREAGERAVSDGVSVVDASGAFFDDHDVPLVVPWINPETLREAPLRGVVAIPQASSLLLGSVLGPLVRAGVVAGVQATVFSPASSEGRDGIDELSRQVVALFNSATPPRKVFEQGLAFDLIPSVGTLAADGTTDRETRAVSELSRLIGPIPASVHVVGVPLFSGMAATIDIRTNQAVSAEQVAAALEAGGVTVVRTAMARQLPRPRKVEGHPFAHVARIRVDEQGIHLWATFDNLRGSAAVAVGVAGLLVRFRK